MLDIYQVKYNIIG